MVKTILYFHGFASSSDSDKAKIIKSYISKISKKIKIFTPDLSNNFKEAYNQITKLIEENKKDFVLVGQTFGRVRALFDEFGKPVNYVGPSTPVVLTGLSATPNVGDQLISTDDEKKVKDIASSREKKQNL